MGKILKRSLIMLLCISMIAALCGISAFAEDAAVAEVGGVPYTSLEDAFNAAYYGDCTIKLLKNAEMSGMATFDLSDGNLILDLNGHDINFTGNTANVASITVTNTRHNLKITGEGTITAEGRALEINSQGTIMTPGLIIDKDVTVISKSEVAIFLWTYNSDVNVYGTVKSQAEGAGAIMGNGNYTLGENKISIYDGAWVEAKSHAIYCPQTGSLNITGGTIKSTGTTAIEMRRGTLNVSGNPTITTEATSYSVKENKSGATTVGAAVAIAPYDAKEIKVSISGGTFTGVKALSYANPNSVANPVVSINVTGGTFSTDITDTLRNTEVTSNLDDISIVEAGGKFTVGSYVAQAGNTKYTSLKEAFNAATTGSTVKLLADATVSKSGIGIMNGKAVTLDLNGHNITNNGCGVFQIYNNGKLDVTGTGKIETTGSYLPFIVQSNITNSEEKIDSVLTIGENVEVISNDYCAIFYIGNGAVVNVRGTVNALGEYAAIQGNGQYSVKDDNNWGRTTLNIYPGAVVTANTTTIYHPQFGGEVNVTGGVITSKDACAIEMRAGKLNVSGDAVIETKATKFEYASNNNGSTTKGAAVAAALYQDRIISINISGGTYKGVKALSYENPNSVVNPDVTINVTGGTFSTDITEALSNEEVKSNIDKLAVVKDSNGYTYSVSDAAVAEVGGEKYASLEAAFAKALTGDTITLLANAKVYSRININNGKKLTLDLGNFNIDNEHSDRLFYVKDGELTVTGQGTVTNNNNDVFVVCGNSNATTWATTAIDSVLTIGEKVKVVSGGDCCIFWQGNGAVANVYGDLTSNGIYATIQGNGSLNDKTNNGGTVLNIFPGASVKATSTATTIYHPQSGTVNVTGGTIDSAEGCGIEMRDGTLNISGDAAVISHADKYESDPNGNGATTVGAAVAIAMYGNGNRVGVLNISGGTFKGVKALSYANPNKVANPNVTINVTGGTFSTDITDALTNAEVKSNIKEYAVAANDDGTYGVKARDEKFENVAAVQRNTNNTLTFLAGINYLDYEKAGFRVTVGSNTKEVSTGTVYTQLNNKGTTSVSVDDFKTNYFFAADFEVLDTSITEFTITPFAKLLNGDEVTGTETKVKVGGAE